MRIAIMQPYFWPYLGYFQLIHSTDVFVIYDDIEYTKGGWINRNRILLNGQDVYVTLPLTKASDYLDVRERRLVPGFAIEAEALLRRLAGAYRKAPFVAEGMEFARATLMPPTENLFMFIHRSVVETMQRLGIERRVVVSSTLGAEPGLAGEARVLRICELLGGKEYVNPPGGRSLYSPEVFRQRKITLSFLEPDICAYPQLGRTDFLPNLSIIDLIMSVGWAGARERLCDYRVVSAT